MSGSVLRKLVGSVERTIGRLLGVILGMAMAFVGLAMGATGVLLPLGVVVGFAGILLAIVAATAPLSDEHAAHP